MQVQTEDKKHGSDAFMQAIAVDTPALAGFQVYRDACAPSGAQEQGEDMNLAVLCYHYGILFYKIGRVLSEDRLVVEYAGKQRVQNVSCFKLFRVITATEDFTQETDRVEAKDVKTIAQGFLVGHSNGLLSKTFQHDMNKKKTYHQGAILSIELVLTPLSVRNITQSSSSACAVEMSDETEGNRLTLKRIEKVATCSLDGTIKLWDFTTLTCEQTVAVTNSLGVFRPYSNFNSKSGTEKAQHAGEPDRGCVGAVTGIVVLAEIDDATPSSSFASFFAKNHSDVPAPVDDATEKESKMEQDTSSTAIGLRLLTGGDILFPSVFLWEIPIAIHATGTSGRTKTNAFSKCRRRIQQRTGIEVEEEAGNLIAGTEAIQARDVPEQNKIPNNSLQEGAGASFVIIDRQCFQCNERFLEDKLSQSTASKTEATTVAFSSTQPPEQPETTVSTITDLFERTEAISFAERLGSFRAPDAVLKRKAMYYEETGYLKTQFHVHGAPCHDDPHKDRLNGSSFAKVDRLNTHQFRVNAMAISADNSFLCSVSDDRAIKMWEILSTRLKLKVEACYRPASCCFVTPTCISTVSEAEQSSSSRIGSRQPAHYQQGQRKCMKHYRVAVGCLDASVLLISFSSGSFIAEPTMEGYLIQDYFIEKVCLGDRDLIGKTIRQLLCKGTRGYSEQIVALSQQRHEPNLLPRREIRSKPVVDKDTEVLMYRCGFSVVALKEDTSIMQKPVLIAATGNGLLSFINLLATVPSSIEKPLLLKLALSREDHISTSNSSTSPVAVLRFKKPSANGSSISKYRIEIHRLSEGAKQAACNGTSEQSQTAEKIMRTEMREVSIETLSILTPFNGEEQSVQSGRKATDHVPCVNDVLYEYELEELLPGGRYSVSVSARNEFGWSSSSKPSESIRCKAGVPHKVDRPSVKRKTHHSLTVFWEYPFHGGVGIERFIIKVKGGNYPTYEHSPARYKTVGQDLGTKQGGNMGGTTEKRRVCCLEVTGLRMNATYNFIISAENRFGVGPFSDPSISTETFPSQQLRIKENEQE